MSETTLGNVYFEEKENVVRDKSYAFALKIIGFYKLLIARKEFVLSKQLLKSGTSIGANIEEALQAQSKNDFISKLSISLKEAVETRYWLRLLRDSKTASTDEIQPQLGEVQELIRMLTAIIRTSKMVASK